MMKRLFGDRWETLNPAGAAFVVMGGAAFFLCVVMPVFGGAVYLIGVALGLPAR